MQAVDEFQQKVLELKIHGVTIVQDVLAQPEALRLRDIVVAEEELILGSLNARVVRPGDGREATATHEQRANEPSRRGFLRAVAASDRGRQGVGARMSLKSRASKADLRREMR